MKNPKKLNPSFWKKNIFITPFNLTHLKFGKTTNSHFIFQPALCGLFVISDISMTFLTKKHRTFLTFSWRFLAKTIRPLRLWKIQFFLSWFKWLSMEDQLYIRKISPCSPLLSFQIFFQDIGCPPPSTWCQACFEKSNESSAQPKLQGRIITGRWPSHPTSWYLVKAGAVKSRWLAPRSRNEVHTMTKASISTSQGFFFRIFFNEKNQSKWGQVRRVATLLRRKSSVETLMPTTKTR